jgi:hypothetical protein
MQRTALNLTHLHKQLIKQYTTVVQNKLEPTLNLGQLYQYIQ